MLECKGKFTGIIPDGQTISYEGRVVMPDGREVTLEGVEKGVDLKKGYEKGYIVKKDKETGNLYLCEVTSKTFSNYKRVTIDTICEIEILKVEEGPSSKQL